MDVHFIPQLIGQIQFDLLSFKDSIDNLDMTLNQVLRGEARAHRESILKEFKRREEKKKEEIRFQREREEHKRKRKEERAAARERHRITLLKEKILAAMAASQSLEDYTSQMKIYDVRDPDGKKDGIYLIGGFVGELIITFMCLMDYILANP